MSSQVGTHQTGKNTYSKFIYFLPTCREAGKVDDPCITANLEKSLSSRVDIHILEAFNNIFMKIFRNLYKSKGRWIRPLLLLTKRMHPPRSGQILESSSAIESLEVEFTSELQRLQQISRLDSYSSRLVNDSGQVRSSAEDPSKVASTSPKTIFTLF